MKDCPVCGKAGLADAIQACPQCNADLECFDLLDALHEEVAVPPPSMPSPTWTKELAELQASLASLRETLDRPQRGVRIGTYGVAALFVIVLGILILVLYRDLTSGRRFYERIAQLESVATLADATLNTEEPPELIAKMEGITQRLGTVEKRLSAVVVHQQAVGKRLSATREYLRKIAVRLLALQKGVSDLTASLPPSPGEATIASSPTHEDRFLYHLPGKDETLWSIAERYYGNGRFYPVLLEYNPGLGIYFDRGYGRIKILRDRQRAQEVLADVTLTQGNRTLFRYRVMEGDTWERLARRFFGHTDRAAELAALNPHTELTAGKRILIPLP
jgi:hypothetical protein